MSSVDFENPEDWQRRVPARPIVPEPSRTSPRPLSRTRSQCPELDCLRGRLPPGTLAAAEQRAIALGTGADRVLIAAGVIGAEEYVRALAGWLRVPFERLEHPREICPLPDEQFLDAEKCGLIPVCTGGTFVWVVAPQNLAARRLASGAHPLPKDRFRLTSRQRLRQYVRHHGAGALGMRASEALRNARPELSAAKCPPRLRAAWIAGTAALIGAGMTFHATAAVLVSAALALTFLGWTILRVVGAATAWRAWRALRMHARDLPIYTIIVALYDEAAAMPSLVDALVRLDYPAEKLQIILVLEPDDVSTQRALARLELDSRFEVLIAPDAGPRTKPKALNAALALARGSFTAVFDAEDRPAADQLQRALDAFLGNGPEIACVQARLTIDNTNDSWLAKIFTAEYAGLFDVLLPGLSAHHLPLPLGGSSNHFVTSVLREIARGWDAYNVTEDADLGMRLARLGFRAAVIDSTTYEEAPARLGPWIRQRTRWFKGWMQTWLVHMRNPVRLARDLGASGFLTFQLVVGGTVLSALVHPVFLAGLLFPAVTGDLLMADGLVNILIATSWLGALSAGYLTSAMLALIGLKRRGLLRHGWVLLLMPLHWLLLSAAAWRAVFQLIRAPYRWEKTAHGLAQSSRLAQSGMELPRRGESNNHKSYSVES